MGLLTRVLAREYSLCDDDYTQVQVPDSLAAEPFRLALAQINATVGDLPGNRDRIIDGIRCAEQLGAEMVAFPELALTGYPPEDLLLKPSFISDNLAVLREIA